ncbi:MAG: hypothetical protein ABW155_19225 [Candidatus Thiodiazotropha sp.]
MLNFIKSEACLLSLANKSHHQKTGRSDADIQQVARELTLLNIREGLFSVVVLGWEDIQQRLSEYKSIARSHYPELFPTLKPILFQGLDFALDRGGKFFPSKSLYDSELVYHLPEENELISDIISQLTTDDGEKLVLLTGAPASGKTVLGGSIGKELQKREFDVFYYSLNNDDEFRDVLNDIYTCDQLRTLVILGNCHLNISITSRIYSSFNKFDNVSCLMISRNVSKDVRYDYENYALDFFQRLDDIDCLFDLSNITKKKFKRKIIGIIEKYRDHKESLINKKLNMGDINVVVNNTAVPLRRE